MRNNTRRTCGVYIFNENKNLLVIKRAQSKQWEVPSKLHTDHKNYLDVAMMAVLDLTGIEFFNYYEHYFKPLKHYTFKNDIFVPYVITGEETVETFECWERQYRTDIPEVDDWKYVSKSEGSNLLIPLHKNVLSQIKI